MAETGYKEIKVAIEKLAKNNMLKGGVKREDTCMYKVDDDSGRYCRATSLTKCGRCKFYEPTTQAVYEACYAEVEHAKSLAEVINSYVKTISDLQKRVLDADHCLGLIEAEARKMKTDGITLRRLWEDSVNTFE